ncbi:hypothetical protein SAMN02745163_04617 [Clostridium cavendishii DSM 21758]|uniref:Putative tail fiber protein gp53-like C-terminal domain-containing protein n=1 Tax=Clostridium cavendishii DSM 21758 TaxID=1121302 RepID=A0A1M6W6Y0_9CLOT|nr:hypothetical protein [Clostridium cavendishii]SHK89532.1 hypothetical protein SAMN02745163_04617 [Clostridium cavendishii DSM 21758]
MGQTKKAIYKIDNGVDFDTIHLQTDVEQILSNIDLSKIDYNGFVKLNKDLILQFRICTNRGSFGRYDFPIVFPNRCISIQATASDPNNAAATITSVNKNNFDLQITQLNSSGYASAFVWAIGC